eukprot:CAMPEP_0175906494 /NCGR_PEP_ID=MMETSP0108-20121206/5573_1 /TAXON_ID=195067 ORGANISM="Goniomonas pacifica, Strain CCMP1869" /NCGR_SAMPLE_ID=MMETSP0108 /ASSEMBLY_ACC=CAM_ASM_000204 /LENGTH=192 /DNA_ID=CAMNT_0017228443 /DNA_START=441 /DNA_END=1019 /DNA_ORIENTATION=+
MFVCSVTLLVLYAGIFSGIDLYRRAEKSDKEHFSAFIEGVQEAPVSLLIGVFCFIVVWFVAGLFGFHGYLLFTNQTTNEQLKGTFLGKVNPYSHNCHTNVAEVLCATLEPSLVAPRELLPLDEVDDVDVEADGVMLNPIQRAQVEWDRDTQRHTETQDSGAETARVRRHGWIEIERDRWRDMLSREKDVIQN